MEVTQHFDQIAHDPKDPDPWLALFLDTSVPMRREAKASILRSNSSRSRQFLLPLVRPFARLFIALFQVLKIFIPNKFTSSAFLHKGIYHGLKRFVMPEANLLILRHFNIGTEILQFIVDNVPEAEIELNPLRPKNLWDLRDHVFLTHDLNIYNFIIRLNKEMREKGIELKAREKLNFDAITDGPFPIEPLPKSWLNFIDLETAIEVYTPLYQLFLTDSDFWRACNSLQLDETVAIYAAKLIGDTSYLSLVNNKHPMIPMSTLKAGNRLMLHGLAAENLHAALVQHKRAQLAAQESTA
ncbi:MAG: hypothetical protein AAF564_08970 [Bacteroidota bacterium]